MVHKPLSQMCDSDRIILRSSLPSVDLVSTWRSANEVFSELFISRKGILLELKRLNLQDPSEVLLCRKFGSRGKS